MKLQTFGVTLAFFWTCLFAQLARITGPTAAALIGDGFECRSFDFESGRTSGCKLAQGATLDQAISGIMVEQKMSQLRNERCGEWADWTLDQNGNVMYRIKNAPCPLKPKPKGYGNYCGEDLAAIGEAALPEGARPRTLGCK